MPSTRRRPGEEPRAILINSDLIKINIEDKGRDKRTGKIYEVGAVSSYRIDGAACDDYRSSEGELSADRA